MPQIRRLTQKSNAPHNHGQRDDEPRPRPSCGARRHSRCAEGGARRSSSIMVHGDLATASLAEHGLLWLAFTYLWVRASRRPASLPRSSQLGHSGARRRRPRLRRRVAVLNDRCRVLKRRLPTHSRVVCFAAGALASVSRDILAFTRRSTLASSNAPTSGRRKLYAGHCSLASAAALSFIGFHVPSRASQHHCSSHTCSRASLSRHRTALYT